jgi:hypothetical protein
VGNRTVPGSPSHLALIGRRRCGFVHRKRLPTRQYNAPVTSKATNRRTVSRLPERDGDLITGFEAIFRPPSPDHIGRVERLYDPRLRVGINILDIDLQKAMRVRPEPFRNRSLYRDFFPALICRVPTMCIQRTCKMLPRVQDLL